MKRLVAVVLVLVFMVCMAGAEAEEDANVLQSPLSKNNSMPLSTYEHLVPADMHELLRLEKAKDLSGDFHYDLMHSEDKWDCSEEYALDSKFTKLVGELFVGYVAPFGNRVTIEMFGDGARIYHCDIDPNDDESAKEIQTIDIDVSGYAVLRIDISASAYHGVYLSNMALQS